MSGLKEPGTVEDGFPRVTGDEPPHPNPWVAQHVRLFLETGGRPRHGIDDLLLTTRGRRSGRAHRTPLVYVRDGADLVVTASNQGGERHPAWYLNLRSDPRATVRVGTETQPGSGTAAMRAARPSASSRSAGRTVSPAPT